MGSSQLRKCSPATATRTAKLSRRHSENRDEIRRDKHEAFWQCAAVKLPNADKVVVERDKVANYLLNAAHPDNGGKAAFFEGIGFRRAESETLAKALQELARHAEVTQTADVAAWPEVCYCWKN